MMKKTVENFAVELVPLGEVARVTGSSPDTIRQLAGDKVAERWDGSLAIPGEVARKIRLDREAEDRREVQLRSEHAGWLQDRAARRMALATKARENVLAGHMANASSSAAVHSAQQAALQEFDSREPERGYYEWRDARPTMAAAFGGVLVG